MQDIRKPYSRSRSNRVLDARVVAFEKNEYKDEDIEEQRSQRREGDTQEVRMPWHVRSTPGDISIYPRKDAYMRPPRRQRSKEMMFLGLLFIGVIAFVYLYTYVFNSAVVTITPKYADTQVNKTVHFVAEGMPKGDNVAFVLATSTLEKSKELPKSEAKKVETKAEGKIIVYNNFDATPQRLLKNTRFESAAGKIYRINTSITVPGKVGDTPGSIEVTVYADSYGEDYNSSPTDFIIPGFKGTPREKGFFARSKGPISGGASGNKKLVSASDLASVKDEFALSLTQDLKNEMKKMTKAGYISLPKDIQVTFADNERDILAGVTSLYKVTATGYLVFAAEEDVARAIAKGRSQYNNEPLRLDHQENLSFALKDGTDISKDSEFDVFFDGTPRIVWKVDENQLRQVLSGKDKNEFVDVLHSFSSIEKAERNISPAWSSHFPDSMNKIEIVEKLPAVPVLSK